MLETQTEIVIYILQLFVSSASIADENPTCKQWHDTPISSCASAIRQLQAATRGLMSSALMPTE